MNFNLNSSTEVLSGKMNKLFKTLVHRYHVQKLSKKRFIYFYQSNCKKCLKIQPKNVEVAQTTQKKICMKIIGNKAGKRPLNALRMHLLGIASVEKI